MQESGLSIPVGCYGEGWKGAGQELQNAIRCNRKPRNLMENTSIRNGTVIDAGDGEGIHYTGGDMSSLASQYYGRNFSIGMIASILLHGLLLSAGFLIIYLTTDDADAIMIKYVGHRDYWAIQQTTIEDPFGVGIRPEVPHAKAGIPVPVVATEIKSDDIFEDAKTYNDPHTAVVDQPGGDPGPVKIEIPPDEADPEPGIFVPVSVDPVPVIRAMPEYPEIARRANMEGTVWVKMLLDKEGRVKKAQVDKSNGDVFNDAALAAAMKWVFRPAMMNDGPVKVWVTIPFRFRLKQ
jgi:TonB family protein